MMPQTDEELKQYSDQKLNEAEKREDARLNAPGFIDRIADAIAKLKRKNKKSGKAPIMPNNDKTR